MAAQDDDVVRVLRDEAQDAAPIDLGRLFTAARARISAADAADGELPIHDRASDRLRRE